MQVELISFILAKSPKAPCGKGTRFRIQINGIKTLYPLNTLLTIDMAEIYAFNTF